MILQVGFRKSWLTDELPSPRDKESDRLHVRRAARLVERTDANLDVIEARGKRVS